MEIKPAKGGAGEKISLDGRANAVLAASILHFGTYTMADVKQFLASKNPRASLKTKRRVATGDQTIVNFGQSLTVKYHFQDNT